MIELFKELRRRGHEIATFSISSKEDTGYWGKASWDDWFDEISGGRSIIERFADITDSRFLYVNLIFKSVIRGEGASNGVLYCLAGAPSPGTYFLAGRWFTFLNF